MARIFDKRWIFGTLNVLLGGLLTLLGFSSCDSSAFNVECLYGQPYTKYSVKGAVLNDEAKPLEGMKVTLKAVYREDSVEYVQKQLEVTTGSKGRYEHRGEVYWSDPTLRIIVDDPNGVYASDSTDVEPTFSKKDAGDWCMGTYEGEASFSLEKKK